MTVGIHHFLIYADKSSSFLWARLFLNMSTANSVNMLKKINGVHCRPKLVISDAGPSFCNDYMAKLREMMIDHSNTDA